MTETNRKVVYHIKNIGEGKKPIWTKIGAAFVNKDGSINVLLDHIPLDGKLHIREESKKRTNQDE